MDPESVAVPLAVPELPSVTLVPSVPLDEPLPTFGPQPGKSPKLTRITRGIFLRVTAPIPPQSYLTHREPGPN
jgi:hypothetical protein